MEFWQFFSTFFQLLLTFFQKWSLLCLSAVFYTAKWSVKVFLLNLRAICDINVHKKQQYKTFVFLHKEFFWLIFTNGSRISSIFRWFNRVWLSLNQNMKPFIHIVQRTHSFAFISPSSHIHTNSFTFDVQKVFLTIRACLQRPLGLSNDSPQLNDKWTCLGARFTCIDTIVVNKPFRSTKNRNPINFQLQFNQFGKVCNPIQVFKFYSK